MRRMFLRSGIRAGAIGGVVTCYFALVGMIEKFDTLNIVGTKGTFTWVLVALPPITAANFAVRPRVIAGERVEADRGTAPTIGAVVGILAGVVVAAGIGLVNLIGVDAVRRVFVAVSPTMLSTLTFHMSTLTGVIVLVGAFAVLGLAGGSLRAIDAGVRRAITNGLAAVVTMGLLQRIVPTALDQVHFSRDWLYSPVTLGLTVIGAVVVFIVAAGATVGHLGHRLREVVRPPEQAGEAGEALEVRFGLNRTLVLVVLWSAIALLLVALPYLVGPVVSEILGTVGIFLLLGLGLNIVVGFAGLLDLGYVAFFAVGAYSTAVLTGGQIVGVLGFEPPAFGAHLSFYVALPIVVAIAALIGVLIGAPVLRLRGDYLAIVTLGFGEIARVVFGSDWASPLFGGPQGMSAITKATVPGLTFQFQDDPRHFYYLVLAFCLIAIYVSYRLQDSRIGRAWNAMREDEQVAGAMGISTIRYKLLAFAMGGAIGSIGGALFAVNLGSLTITSFQILVSITALAVIILGGMGSIPGVVVGALVLIGLPGVLSEFEEFRLLIYGGALIAIMLLRPQGLVPNVRRMRELQEEERAQDQWGKELLEQQEEREAAATAAEGTPA